MLQQFKKICASKYLFLHLLAKTGTSIYSQTFFQTAATNNLKELNSTRTLKSVNKKTLNYSSYKKRTVQKSTFAYALIKIFRDRSGTQFYSSFVPFLYRLRFLFFYCTKSIHAGFASCFSCPLIRIRKRTAVEKTSDTG